MRDTRPWTYAALFGTLWGAVELSLGTVLQIGRLPLRGVLLGIFGILCLVTLRRLQPKIGVCLLAGTVAAFLKVFSLGGLYPGPLIGIGVQAVFVELGFLLTAGTAAGAVIGGALALMAGPLQMIFTTWVIAGREAVASMMAAMARGLHLMGLPPVSPIMAVTIVMCISGGLGALAGAWSWRVAGRVRRRLGGAP